MTELIKSKLPQGAEVVRDTAGQSLVRFKNNYGVSVVSHEFSYGLELAVIHWNSLLDRERWQICYTTPITGDVVGYLTQKELKELVRAVSELPENQYCTHWHPEPEDEPDE